MSVALRGAEIADAGRAFDLPHAKDIAHCSDEFLAGARLTLFCEALGGGSREMEDSATFQFGDLTVGGAP